MTRRSALDDALAAFFDARESAHSRRGYLHDWQAFEAAIMARGLAVLTVKPADVQAYLSTLRDAGKSKATRARALSVVRSVYHALVVAGLLPANPAVSVRNPKTDHAPKTPWLDEPGVRALLDALPAGDGWRQRRDRLAVLLLVGLGWRRAEVARLRVEDFRAGTVTGVVKGGKVATVGVPAWLTSEIERWRRFAKLDEGALLPRAEGAAEPMTDGALYQVVKAASAKAGVEVTPHGLRRTFITTLRGRGADLKTLQTAVAHSSSATTERYDRARTIAAPGEDLADLVYGEPKGKG